MLLNKVVYFGTYDQEYSRNRIIIKGLQDNQIEVVECHYPLWDKVKRNDYSISNLIKLAFWWPICFVSLLVQYDKLLTLGKKNDIDYIIVGYPGFLDIGLLNTVLSLTYGAINQRPIVIFDAYLSWYDSVVIDRQNVDSKTEKAKAIFSIEKRAYRTVDCILLDTNEHISYVSQLFEVPRYKFIRVPIGADDTIFRYTPRDYTHNELLWWGTYIPLQGVETLIASISGATHLTMVGDGQMKNQMIKNHKNIQYWPKLPQSEIVKMSSDYGIAMGIFGSTSKADRVVPNKVYEALALGMPVITADTLAVRELGIKSGIHAITVPPGDPTKLKEAIERLSSDKRLRERISKAGNKLFKQRFTPKAVVQELIEAI
jgi:glycosyltransferase involved in cell wall biosynthesis